MAVRDLRRCPADTVARLRRQVVRLASTGITRNLIADRLGLRRATITTWLQTLRSQGTRGLSALARGRPPAAPVPQETLLRALLIPPTTSALWTTRSAAERVATRLGLTLSPRGLHRRLITSGLLPPATRTWTEQDASRQAIAAHPRHRPYLLTATPIVGREPGWAFHLLDTTGRYAFLFALGPLRLKRWIGFLERGKRWLATEAVLLLMRPGWLCQRPSVRRWIDQQHGRLRAVGIDG